MTRCVLALETQKRDALRLDERDHRFVSGARSVVEVLHVPRTRAPIAAPEGVPIRSWVSEKRFMAVLDTPKFKRLRESPLGEPGLARDRIRTNIHEHFDTSCRE